MKAVVTLTDLGLAVADLIEGRALWTPEEGYVADIETIDHDDPTKLIAVLDNGQRFHITISGITS